MGESKFWMFVGYRTQIFVVMALQLYSNTFVDIIYGEGLLGFRLGKTDDDYPVVKGFDKKEDGSSQPLEV